ncbi:eclosion hormone [Mycetomoellerius zeteki]|uniref:eclosion hormone n=1 Tax=Mycetomoellerius zeteki TaxID=64791 RepID=UPI00084E8F58|nr:PREDICTED: eclosion hormone [Trachymyrmex zeteki]XP_018305532.1 PREDICTED: eclosion hormone [Trachymyrmex zeteki]
MPSLSNRIMILLIMVFAILCFTVSTDAERNIGVCIRNCAQCRKMFGVYFMGQKCADFCVKYKGKLIPDCEDEFSIRPFLQVAENDY